MDTQVKNPIIRREKFTVQDNNINQYGDLIVTSSSGKEYKVGKKRANLFDAFQPDTEVVVGWSSYMNKDYIAEATPAQQVVSTDTPIEPEQPKPAPQTVKAPAHESKNSAFALSYAKDMVVKTLAEGEDIPAAKIDSCIMIAEAFRMWLDGELKLESGKLAKLVTMIAKGN